MKSKINGIFLTVMFSAMLTACLHADKDDRSETSASYTAAALGASLTAADSAEQTSAPAETESSTISETTVQTEDTTVTENTELPFEDTVQNAYQRLMNSFETENGIVYPDDFAGVYSFAGTLFVAVTVPEPAADYMDILGSYTCIRFRTASRSYNELEKAAESAAELLDERFEVSEYYVDAPSNKAAVVIKNEDPKSAQNYLKSLSGLDFTLDEVAISMADREETVIS